MAFAICHALQLIIMSFGMQDVFNLLPNLSVEELLRSFAIKSNDMMLAVYLASMIRRYPCLDILMACFPYSVPLPYCQLDRGTSKQDLLVVPLLNNGC